MYLVCQFRYYQNDSEPIGIIKTKKDLKSWCKKEGYKYCKENDYFTNDERAVGLTYSKINFL